MKSKSKIILPITAAVFILDRLTKILVIERMEYGSSFTVINGLFDITYVRNTGAAFGFMALMDASFRVPFFLITTVAAVGLLFYFIVKTPQEEKLMFVALSLILGGALGNLTDRVLYGYVIDFIDWHVSGHYWPAFNIADSAITAGVVLLGIETIFVNKK